MLLSTHHQHIRVNFVHLCQEEAEQSSLRLGYFHFSVLKREKEVCHNKVSGLN